MLTPRLIPCLLLRGEALVKTVRFKDPAYVGDPANTIRIYNEKEVDEIILLDIRAGRERHAPNLPLLKDLTSECFMPLAYGGGLETLQQMDQLFTAGIEKVAINTAAHRRPALITEAAREFGSQAIVVSVDVALNWRRKYDVRVQGGTQSTGMDPVTAARQAQDAGAGELLLTSIDRDGTFEGYDLKLVKSVASAVSVPVVSAGGARDLADVRAVVREAGSSAAAVGSMVVYQGPHRAVLINYPAQKQLRELFA